MAETKQSKSSAGSAQPAEKPVVAKKATVNEQKLRFVILAEGQGGASIGTVLANCLPGKPFMIAVNTSEQDLAQLNLPEQQKFKIGGINADGAGKNRNRAKAYFKNFEAVNVYNKGQKLGVLETMLGYYEEVFFHPTEQTIIIVCFSSDGGTGSGLGPMITASLANYMTQAKNFKFGGKEYTIDDVTNSVPRPVVVGLVPKCQTTSGATNLQNTIECFADIQRLIDNGIGHFFIADNNLEGVEYNSTEEMYRIINARIVAPFVKFFGVEMNSDIKCMDLQDKINTLRISGASSFVSVTPKNMYQYVIPHGQSVTRTVMMMRHDPDNPGTEEKLSEATLRKLDIDSIDKTPVFFQVDKSGIAADSVSKDLIQTSMIGLFGWKSLNSIVEDLRDNLHRIQVANDKKASVVQTNSQGFSTMAEDAEELNDRFGSKSIDQSALMDLL